MYRTAITRRPAPTFDRGLTTANLGRPSFELMLEQHRRYVAALRELGLEVLELEPDPGHPDAHFVEDTAVVTPELAVVTRPGAPSRRGEEETVAPHLARHRPLARIEAPGTVDGGDVLVVGRRLLIGLSERTNRDGAEQLARALEPHGYRATRCPVGAGLHLKSSVNHVGSTTLLVTPGFAGRPELAGFDLLVVEPEEAYAANTLYVNGHLLVPAGFPATRRTLAATGLPVVELDTSEARKMDGGLTCLSIRF